MKTKTKLTKAMRETLTKLARVKRGDADYRRAMMLCRRGFVEAIFNPKAHKAHGGWKFAITNAGRAALKRDES